MRPSTPNLNLGRPARPSSPPETPTTASPIFNRNVGPHDGPFAKHHAQKTAALHASNMRHSGNGMPLRAADLSPRSSSSSEDEESNENSSDSDVESSGSECGPRSLSSGPAETRHSSPVRVTARVVTAVELVVEEISDFDDSDVDVLRPHRIEYADSDRSRSRSRNPGLDHGMMHDFSNLTCQNDEIESDDSDLDLDERERMELIRRYRATKKEKRINSGSIGKRTISESIGSGSDNEDTKRFDELGSSARRLRRRVGDRFSLQFMDPPRIDEVAEPNSDDEYDSVVYARELPYFDVEVMEIDTE